MNKEQFAQQIAKAIDKDLGPNNYTDYTGNEYSIRHDGKLYDIYLDCKIFAYQVFETDGGYSYPIDIQTEGWEVEAFMISDDEGEDLDQDLQDEIFEMVNKILAL